MDIFTISTTFSEVGLQEYFIFIFCRRHLCGPQTIFLRTICGLRIIFLWTIILRTVDYLSAVHGLLFCGVSFCGSRIIFLRLADSISVACRLSVVCGLPFCGLPFCGLKFIFLRLIFLRLTEYISATCGLSFCCGRTIFLRFAGGQSFCDLRTIFLGTIFARTSFLHTIILQPSD